MLNSILNALLCMNFLNKISKITIETYLQNNALTNLEKREFASYISGYLRH